MDRKSEKMDKVSARIGYRKMKELISDLYKLRNDIAHHASRNQYDAVPLSITSDALCDYRDGVISIAEAIDMVVRMKSL